MASLDLTQHRVAKTQPFGRQEPRRMPAPRPAMREAVRELAAALRNRINGEERFDTGSRAAYSTDHSIYRAVPIGVVIPRHVEDVLATVEACRATS